MGELYTLSPIFAGISDIDQLSCVLQKLVYTRNLLGTPSEKQWPEMLQLPDFKKIHFDKMEPKPFEKIIPNADKTALDLIRQFLKYRSQERISAKKVT